MPIKGEEKIFKPKSYDERSKIATKCVAKLKIDMPCLIDGIDNTVGDAYSAWPDRLFVVDKEGKIVVRAGRGPWGFPPAVNEATKWLEKNFPDAAQTTKKEEPSDG